jgi:proline dehydrogenase
VRSLFLYLSSNRNLRNFMETSSLARRVSGRFVAGSSLDEALAACRTVNRDGLTVTLDYLGENVSSLDEAKACRDMYLRSLGEIQSRGIQGNVSLKLSQFGMDLSEDACRATVRELVQAAAGTGNFVRIDMESSAYTERTLQIVYDLFSETKSCGAVIQAYLKRSESDIDQLNGRGIRVRLCKGAYLEPETVALQAKAEVDLNFVKLAKKLLTEGNYPGIATHDEAIVNQIIAFVKEQEIAPERFEFQMLYGIRRDLQTRLIRDGYRMRLYVPFGEAWYPYFMRRLAERPANVLFIARQFLRG